MEGVQEWETKKSLGKDGTGADEARGGVREMECEGHREWYHGNCIMSIDNFMI